MTPDPVELEVRLGRTRVGTLRSSGHHERVEFTFASEYLDLPARPVLGQWFLDHLRETHTSTMRLPRWFSHLLPEGQLRRMIAERAGLHGDREFHLIALLGADLPGNVVVSGPVPEESGPPPEIGPRAPETGEIRFSLAGVQLKFSAARSERGLTIPASGQGEEWIVKIPGARFEALAENELSIMTWAARSGLSVPDIDIVPLARIQGLPAEVRDDPGSAFVIRRFDRAPGGVRIHIDDFAQVLNIDRGEEAKYRDANYERIGLLIRTLTGREDFDEFVRRLVFVVLSGNGDAHLKNWSLIYPDGVTARLAPVYDQVFTLPYVPGDALALNLDRTKPFTEIRDESFRRLARVAGEDEDRVAGIVREFAEKSRAAWSGIRDSLPLPAGMKDRLGRHLDAVRLGRVGSS